jgi:hypothetical protein
MMRLLLGFTTLILFGRALVGPSSFNISANVFISGGGTVGVLDLGGDGVLGLTVSTGIFRDLFFCAAVRIGPNFVKMGVGGPVGLLGSIGLLGLVEFISTFFQNESSSLNKLVFVSSW